MAQPAAARTEQEAIAAERDPRDQLVAVLLERAKRDAETIAFLAAELQRTS